MGALCSAWGSSMQLETSLILYGASLFRLGTLASGWAFLPSCKHWKYVCAKTLALGGRVQIQVKK